MIKFNWYVLQRGQPRLIHSSATALSDSLFVVSGIKGSALFYIIVTIFLKIVKNEY